MRKKFCFFFIISFFFLLTSLHAQNPSYHLFVESGGLIDFKIYSLSRYEGGITYENWTRLKIVYRDTTPGTQVDKWNLSFKANTPKFYGSMNEFPLNYISIEASDHNSSIGGSAIINTNKEALSEGSYIDLVNDGDEGTYWLDITYHLDSSLVGRSTDYYTSELLFQLDTLP
mgnify:CR=1 FL=1